MEHFVEILKDQVQIVALSFMAIVYALRIRWLLKFAAPKERTPARGSQQAGINYAMMNIDVLNYPVKREIRFIEDE